LELLRLAANIPYIYRECAIGSEFGYYIRKWTLKRYAAYPILYIAAHGTEEGVSLDDGDHSLEEIAEALEGRCTGRIIIVASCSALSVNRRHIRRFLEITNALAVCGYRKEVDWMQATAFELLLLNAMQENELSGRGIDAIASRVKAQARSFRELGFRIVSKRDLGVAA
jgi:hypothetical protein